MPAPRPAAPDPHAPDLIELRRRYELTDDPAADICRDHAITASQLAYAARKHKWRRSMPRPFPAGRRTPAPQPADAKLVTVTPELAPPRVKPITKNSAAARRALLDRLAAAISLKLEQLERRMSKDLAHPDTTEATPTDHERETRAIGALIDNLGKVTEMDTATPRASPKSGRASAAATAGHASSTADLAGEADRYRRELAARLQKLIDAARAKS
ncbi:MAG: hypothetical protein ACKVP7_08600 [Hyphomicrobiaceae bacterium]